MKPVPQQIKAANGKLSIQWSDGHAGSYQGRDLRLGCRCAACVDEWSHQSLIRPERVPEDVKPLSMEIMGQYALHIAWSDGHNTGIYTYDYLREVCACDECKAKRSFHV